MDFNELIRIRESCRNFSNQKINKEHLEKIIEMARLSPSACNSQPWSMHVIYSDNLLPKISDSLQSLGMNKFTSDATAFIIVCEEKEAIVPKIGGKIKNEDYASIDIGILISHIVLGASSIGLSSCIIGWFNQNKIKTTLNLPKKTKVRIVIALGYSKDNKIREKKRKDLDKIVKFY